MKNMLNIMTKSGGIPVHDDSVLYEALILENFQAGLSWECILNKRESFRKAYHNFDLEKVILFDENKKKGLMENSGIIRNRLKIEASINNSCVFKSIQQEFGSFDEYLWSFTDHKVIIENTEPKTRNEISDKVSEDLKRRGMKFVGSVTIYAYLQAVGVINSHDRDCVFFDKQRER